MKIKIILLISILQGLLGACRHSDSNTDNNFDAASSSTNLTAPPPPCPLGKTVVSKACPALPLNAMDVSGIRCQENINQTTGAKTYSLTACTCYTSPNKYSCLDFKLMSANPYQQCAYEFKATVPNNLPNSYSTPAQCQNACFTLCPLKIQGVRTSATQINPPLSTVDCCQ